MHARVHARWPNNNVRQKNMMKIPKLLRALITSDGQTAYTFDWPRVAEAPDIRLDLAAGSIGVLRFGDHIDAAKPFGRPNDYHRHQGKGCALLYFDWGIFRSFPERMSKWLFRGRK